MSTTAKGLTNCWVKVEKPIFSLCGDTKAGSYSDFIILNKGEFIKLDKLDSFGSVGFSFFKDGFQFFAFPDRNAFRVCTPEETRSLDILYGK